jgi:hypothetical protein
MTPKQGAHASASPIRAGARATAACSRRRFLAFLAAGSSIGPVGFADASTLPSPASIAEEVRAEFLHAWRGYRANAWGYDELRPLSEGHNDFFAPNVSFGLSIVEALDTLYLLGLDEELDDSIAWLRSNLSFDVDADIQMFEAVIRLVGGLIAGYGATGETFLLAAAHDLATRLLPCFTQSPTGVPYRYVNLKTGHVGQNVTNLAEACSNILEFGELSRLTGDGRFLAASRTAYSTIIAKRSELDLLGTSFDVERGAFVDVDDAAPNPPADSFYEYLWGAWTLFGDRDALRWYHLLTDAILKHKRTTASGRTWFQNVDCRSGAASGAHTQSELGAFYAELLAKGGNRRIGEAYYDSWTAAADHFTLIPETFDYTDFSIVDPGYQLRPEYANSAFDLWSLTHNKRYRVTGYSHFRALRDHCKVSGGYTIIKDIRTSPMTLGDLLPAYVFAENFKYLFLLFGTTPRFDASQYYLSTEGKVLRGFHGTRASAT